ncbi:MAG TPA: ABC transporter substrate-binding protein [Candidatus Saccharimonadales bacterium]|nr:ABC transporter substrate-binding protein [Candidatus Saccharimonadales bacterium]
MQDEDLQNNQSTPQGTNASATPTPPAADSGKPMSGMPMSGGPGKSKKMMWMVVALVVVVVLALGGAGYAMMHHKTAKKTATTASLPHVKVGFMMAQTGGAASMGLGAIKGVQLAMKQLATDNIQLIQVDSKCDAADATTAIKQLIADKVVAIIGEGCSSASVAVLPLANAAKIPMVSPSASSPVLSIANDYFFRTVPSDHFQGKYLADYAYKKGIRKVGQFYTAEPAGQAFTDVFKQEFTSLGGQIVSSASVDAGSIDVASQASQIAASKPEAVTVFTNTVTTAVAFINTAHQDGYSGDYFGSDALYDKTVIGQTGTASESHLTVSNFDLGTKAFKQAMANEYHSSDLAYAAPQAYDALHAIFIATQRGATTGEQIKNMLPSIEFDGVSGYHIKFDENGEISDPRYVRYSLLQVQNGDFVELNQ